MHHEGIHATINFLSYAIMLFFIDPNDLKTYIFHEFGSQKLDSYRSSTSIPMISRHTFFMSLGRKN